MNWDALGAIGEIVGSIAVVVTVAYLAIQVRHSSRASRSATINQSRAAVTDVLTGISSDSAAADIYFRGANEPESLNASERVRFELIVFQMLRVTETMFMEYREGLLGQELWDAQWYGTRLMLETTGGRLFWKRRNRMLTRSFIEWVDKQFEDGNRTQDGKKSA